MTPSPYLHPTLSATSIYLSCSHDPCPILHSLSDLQPIALPLTDLKIGSDSTTAGKILRPRFHLSVAPTKPRTPTVVRTMRLERGLFEEHYQICGYLGRGKFATVYKCLHRETQQYFAAKLCHAHSNLVDTEISILSRFAHMKNIVNLHAVYQDSRESVLVLDLVPGGELLDLLGRTILTEYDVTGLIRQLCSTLYCLHYKNIVHMDIKPENLLVTACPFRPNLRLVDFGLSQILTPNRPGCLEEIGGTPEFLAPEILRSAGRRVVTPAVDMWCVGVTTYIALTGVSPFQGEGHVETVANILNSGYYSGDELFGCYSRDALDFISKLLEPVPGKRLTAADCLSHPWLSKKKRSKQRQVMLSPLVFASFSGGGKDKSSGDSMGFLKHNLKLHSVPGHNVKPSTIRNSYKSAYK